MTFPWLRCQLSFCGYIHALQVTSGLHLAASAEMPPVFSLMAPISDYALISPRYLQVYFSLPLEHTGLRAFVLELDKILGSKPNSQPEYTSGWINNNRELSSDMILSFVLHKRRRLLRKSGSCVSSRKPGPLALSGILASSQ